MTNLQHLSAFQNGKTVDRIFRSQEVFFVFKKGAILPRIFTTYSGTFSRTDRKKLASHLAIPSHFENLPLLPVIERKTFPAQFLLSSHTKASNEKNRLSIAT
jgi:hypothetical protein